MYNTANNLLDPAISFRSNNKPFLLDTDENYNKYYQVNFTPKLNVWAAKAAQELKNFTPIFYTRTRVSSTLGSGSLEKQ